MNSLNKWTTYVDGDGVMILPDELLLKMNWKEGDILDFVNNKDGSITMKKVDKNNIYVVETVSIHKSVYAIRANNKDAANEAVILNNLGDLTDIHQVFLEEHIISNRQVTDEQYIREFHELNGHFGDDWSDETVLKQVYDMESENL